MPPLHVTSEVAALNVGLVRRPGPEFALLTPDRLGPWLFDDIVHCGRIQQEHDIFTRCLRALGVTLLNFDELLLGALKNPDAARFILRSVLRDKVSADRCQDLALNTDPLELANYLLRGVPPIDSHGLPTFNPMLNTIFTRDIGVVMGHEFLPTIASKPARKREMRLTSALFRAHPDLNGANHIRHPKIWPMEGGDFQVLSEEIVCIGVSERTSIVGVHAIIPALHKIGFRHVVIVEMARRRSCMHLDTIFTMISDGECIVFKPMILDTAAECFCEVQVHSVNSSPTTSADGLLPTLRRLGLRLEPVLCGGDDPLFQLREQWTDGSNALAVRPGVILTYDRNERTVRALETHGYRVLSANDVQGDLTTNGKCVITLPDSELSRGRGGPHCLMMPLHRSALCN